jgi:hypothetical protein
MCAVSMVGDEFTRRINTDYPWHINVNQPRFVPNDHAMEIAKLKEEVKVKRSWSHRCIHSLPER